MIKASSLLRASRILKVAGAVTFLLIGIAGIVNWRMLGAPKNALTWDTVFAWIQKDWPAVPQISTQELAERMAASSNIAGPLLIDVRTREEYEVSHLPGAVWAETPGQIAVALRETSDRRAVVFYCSVGVRSSKAAAKLVESRRANVFNLKGSIFKWANEGRPLVADDHAVHVVHPYNERWSVLLKPELRSD